MRVSVTCDDVEDDNVEQPQDIIWRHQLSRPLEYVGQCRSANSGLVRFVLGRRRLTERLAKVFLVQSPPTATNFLSVVPFDEKIRSPAGLSGRDLWHRDVQPFGQGQTKCLVLHTTPKALCIG